MKVVFTLLFFLLLTSCRQENTEALTPEQKAQKELVARGKVVYMSYCIACHNMNPKMPGAIGPDIYGAALELIELKVLEQKYPEGYTPKRKTLEMPTFEDLKSDIPAIHAFLNSGN